MWCFTVFLIIFNNHQYKHSKCYEADLICMQIVSSKGPMSSARLSTFSKLLAVGKDGPLIRAIMPQSGEWHTLWLEKQKTWI